MDPVSVDVIRVKVLFDGQCDLVDLSPQPDDSIGQLVAEPSDSIAQSVTTPVHIIVEFELQGPPRVSRRTNGEPQRVPDVSRRRWVGLSTECLRQLGERELTAGHDQRRTEVGMLEIICAGHTDMITDPHLYRGRMPKKKRDVERRIRLGTDAVIDEQGLPWERVRSADTYYASNDEVTGSLAKATRFLDTGAYGSPAVELSRGDFDRLRVSTPGHPVLIFRAADRSGRILMTINTSDC